MRFTNAARGLISVFLLSAQFDALVRAVHVESGMLIGTATGSAGVLALKGIPLSAPPVGDLRWKAPQP